ncbi:MAG: DNA methyltransferase [Planctomycetota bacterium]
MPRWKPQLDELIAGRRRHVAIGGDCIPAMAAMDAGAFDACVVDPPYGVSWKGVDDQRRPIANDRRPFIWFLGGLDRVLKPDAALACFHVERLQQEWKAAIEIAGFTPRGQFIWDKGHGGMGDCARSFSPRDERAWIASRGRWRLPCGRPDSILRCPNVPPAQRRHPTEKPVEVMAYLVRHLVRPGGIVFDPTMGSGSTGVAALKEGRRFVGIELDPHNLGVARKRLRDAEASHGREPRAKLAPVPHYCFRGVAAA